jgi:hypothetical protein
LPSSQPSVRGHETFAAAMDVLLAGNDFSLFETVSYRR